MSGTTCRKYKLSYFNYRGGGEIIRLIFSVGNVYFEDERIEKCDWPNKKPAMPMRNLPALSITDEGKETMYCQSGAIARYLAKEFDLYGNTAEETLLIDEVYDCVGDVRKLFIQIYFENDANMKIEAERKLRTEVLPNFNAYINQRKTEFGENGFLIGSKLTLADLAVFNMVDSSILMGQEDIWSPYPVLLEHRKQLMNNNNLMKWLNTRPVTSI